MVTAPDKKPGRNEPPWCGSGKKYKHCHLRQDQEAAQAERQAAAAEALAAALPPMTEPFSAPRHQQAIMSEIKADLATTAC